MAITNYTQLKASVADWLNRSDLTAVIPDFIALAEAELRRRLRGRVARAALTLDAEEVALPTDFEEPFALALDSGGYTHELEILSAPEFYTRRGRYPASGVPIYGAFVNRVLLLTPAPSDSYTAKLDYYAGIEALSDTVTTNWLLQEHPDIYLYGSLSEAEPYLKNDERLAVWKAQFDRKLVDLETKFERQFLGPTPRLASAGRAFS